MATLHLPGTEPTPETPGLERVPLTRLAGRSSGSQSPALTRAVAAGARSGPGRVAVAAFQSSV